MISTFRFTIYLFAAILLASGNALADCPDGKVELVIDNPAGMQKAICVAESGANGIADSSGSGPISSAASCPCWDESELPSNPLLSNNACATYYDPDAGAVIATFAYGSTNHTPFAFLSISQNACYFSDGTIERLHDQLSDAEVNACSSAIESSGMCPADSQGKTCMASGCNGEACSTETVFSTCEVRPEYVCISGAMCENVNAETCGYIATDSSTEACIADWFNNSRDDS